MLMIVNGEMSALFVVVAATATTEYNVSFFSVRKRNLRTRLMPVSLFLSGFFVSISFFLLQMPSSQMLDISRTEMSNCNQHPSWLHRHLAQTEIESFFQLRFRKSKRISTAVASTRIELIKPKKVFNVWE